MWIGLIWQPAAKELWYVYFNVINYDKNKKKKKQKRKHIWLLIDGIHNDYTILNFLHILYVMGI